jgi:type II secretion system protein D
MMLELSPIVLAMPALAQAGERRTEGDGASMVSFDLPERVHLEVLVEYVGRRNGINFIHEEGLLGGKQIALKTPNEVPASSLMQLLSSALRMNGLMMTEADVEGMMRIQNASSDLVQSSRGPETSPATQSADQVKHPMTAVTRVFRLAHAKPEQVLNVLDPFLSASAASVKPLPGHNMLIVTDYARNMRRVERVLEIVDQPGRSVSTRFLKVEHLQAKALAEKAKSILEGKADARGGDARSKSVAIVPAERTNQLVVVGTAAGIKEVVSLVETLDVSLGLKTRIYKLDVASPEQVDALVKKLISDVQKERFYKSATDPEANLLVVTTTKAIHQQIQDVRTRLDEPIEQSQSPMRFYELEHAKATEVIRTIQQLDRGGRLARVNMERGSGTDGGNGSPKPRGHEEQSNEVTRLTPSQEEVNRGRQRGARRRRSATGATSGAARLRGARIMADKPTNTIIVVAKPSMHPVYGKLIEKLDARRPQVLVEATVVTIDTSDEFELGVEINSEERADGGTLLNFTQFGLSTRDSATGDLAVTLGQGFTGALLNSDTAEVVLRALQSDARARVVSRPSVLIDDNATGTLVSQQEEPFESINSTPSEVATRSLGGYATAGTNIEISPQISEGDHLKLDYDITLSSFDEEGSGGVLPPARQTNQLASEATIPDGHTIVVGGLTRENSSEDVDRVPILGELPIIEYAFSNRTRDLSKTTLYVFIRARVLRDNKFKGLRVLSTDALRKADLDEEYPSSEPATVER